MSEKVTKNFYVHNIANIELEIAINVYWISLATYLVFLMQLGFAFVEGGSVRQKNLVAILFKNLIDITTGTVVWYFVGYAFAFGADNGNMIGTTHFFLADCDDYYCYLIFLFEWAFAGACATIVSGSVAERMPIIGYILQSVFIISWIFPVICHWGWGGGWLMDLGFHDFAGSGIVHLTGGASGLVLTILIGARIGRFDRGETKSYLPHNIMFCVLGSLLLWFSWYGFNCGSTLSVLGENLYIITIVRMNTTLGAVGSTFATTGIHLYYSRNSDSKYSASVACNGLLAGLVAITAGCDNYEPYVSLFIGILAGITYYSVSGLLIKLKIDDPLDASPVHGGCGVLGVICVGLFDRKVGLFYSGSGHSLGIQSVGILAIIGWVVLFTYPFAKILSKFGLLREGKFVEEMGLDSAYCGGSAYSEDYSTGNISDEKALRLIDLAEQQGLIRRLKPRTTETAHAHQKEEFLQKIEKKISEFNLTTHRSNSSVNFHEHLRRDSSPNSSPKRTEGQLFTEQLNFGLIPNQ